MDIKPGEITDILKREIRDYDRDIDVAETGTVLSAGDGIARVYGLEKALAGELVEFPGDVSGMILNLEEGNVGVALLLPLVHSCVRGQPKTCTKRLQGRGPGLPVKGF